MNMPRAEKPRQAGFDFAMAMGLVAAIVFFVASGFISYENISILRRDTQEVTHTHEVISNLDILLSLVKDTETGQRGFILTGSDQYLAPYTDALAHIRDQITLLERITQDNPEQHSRVSTLEAHIKAKLDELAETIRLRRVKGFDAALAVVASDRGKNEMDTLRLQVESMKRTEEGLRVLKLQEMDRSFRLTIVSALITALIGLALSFTVGYLIQRSNLARKREEWLQSGEVGLAKALFGEQRLEKLGENILQFLTQYLDAHAGAFFTQDGNTFRRIAVFGLPADNKTPKRFEPGESLLGQVVKDARAVIMHDVPEGYLTVGSGLGQGSPRHLVIAPAINDGTVNAVLELGFIHPLDELTLELLNRMSESIAVAIRSANYRASLQNFLEETQRQSEELQAQSEELRVSNEELEEQSRALKESQTRLEQQQAEMEQTNAQLEEQTQILERQRDDISRTTEDLQVKARELEQASQYKSDFLANMSHELRTPLNSSLILAKLLADNPDGNLSEEQVKFAHTIQSSGNDLLSLINDILDLSKIEAGHMEIRPEPVQVKHLFSDLSHMFEPITKQKGLAFGIRIDAACPDMVQTDRQRLEQVLKNLLSNAIKFTEKGKVELSVGMDGDGMFAFSVTDTGIGISDNQQQLIFEAFRQADGTISRKYGGTGLGLSISRQLARLLGGRIRLESTPGTGSSFTISIPQQFTGPVPAPTPSLLPNIQASKQPATVETVYTPHIEDDRAHLQKNRRLILVVEDDEMFAHVLRDLAHELDFQCVVATTAEDGLAAAMEYMPDAVLLDVGLPDNSGLSVLDRLKRNVHTRHIPVHVVSGSDYTQTALSLGAVGYMIKPVKREELLDALKNMETKLEQSMRRILIVEDDAVQRDSMRKLLGTRNVETIGVGTAAECMRQLKDSTFDCMILDLSLPDATGHSLLETLSQEKDCHFPPVIVYTGRDLSTDEEQRLRRYSKSIIIKGAKSPERLLDEVTLFLHQVVSDLPPEQQTMLEKARNRDAVLEGRRILVVEDDIANVYALTSILEPRGAIVHIARNGVEALNTLEKDQKSDTPIDLVLMDMMMPEMDGLTATRAIRKKSEWKKLPVIMLTAKAMRNDQERCIAAGANDYMAKPLDVEKLLSLVRVWMPR